MTRFYSNANTAGRTKLLLVEKKPQNAKELAESAFNLIRYRDYSIREVARLYKVTDAEALALYLEGDSAHEEKIVRAAFRAGKLSGTPNWLPVAA